MLSVVQESALEEQSVEVARTPSVPVRDYSWFKPKEYLAEYYSAVGDENQFLLSFYHRAYRSIPDRDTVLEFGGGPTIYQLISASERSKSIVFADYLPQNRDEVREWLAGGDSAHNWDEYFEFVRAMDGNDRSSQSTEDLKQHLKTKLCSIIECDANLPNVLWQSDSSSTTVAPFDVVSSSFCLECIGPSEELFCSYMTKVDGLVKQGGHLVLTMLKRAEWYQVGSSRFPAFSVDESYMIGLLGKLGYEVTLLDATPAEAHQGYAGLMGLCAQKF